MKIKITNKYQISFMPEEIDLEPGLTIITGCNGSGKTMISNYIRDYCRENMIKFKHLDARNEFHKSDANDSNDIETLVRSKFASEYEAYKLFFGDFIRGVRAPDSFKDKDYFVILDGIDSGGDVFNFSNHCEFFDFMVKDAESRGIRLYLIVTCNNFSYLVNTTGKVIWMPNGDMYNLPYYREDEYSRYVEDIISSAKKCNKF